MTNVIFLGGMSKSQKKKAAAAKKKAAAVDSEITRELEKTHISTTGKHLETSYMRLAITIPPFREQQSNGTFFILLSFPFSTPFPPLTQICKHLSSSN